MHGDACYIQAVQGSRILIHGFVACLWIQMGSSFVVRLHLGIVGVVEEVRGCSVIWYGSRWDLDWIVPHRCLGSTSLVVRREMAYLLGGSEWDQMLSWRLGFPCDVLIVPGLPWVLDPDGIRILWDLLFPCMKIFRIFLAWYQIFSYLCIVIQKHRAMKEILKVFVILLVAVFVVPLLWLLIKEIWWLIVPLFAGIEVGNAFWVILFVVAIVVIVWALSS